MRLTLPYGQAHVLPDLCTAAWGARLIVSQQGFVDFVHDRMSADGPDRVRLLGLLNERFPDLPQVIGDLLGGEVMNTREREDFIVYMDNDVIVHANTNGSGGYCYVTAWLQAEPLSSLIRES